MYKLINYSNVKNIRDNILKLISTPTNKQVWIVGPEGRGKTTFVKGLFDNLKNQNSQTYITSYFDFNNVKDYNFQTVLVKFIDSLLLSASKLTHSNNRSLERVFDDLKSRFPKFEQHSSVFFNHLAQSNILVLNNNKAWKIMVESMNKNKMVNFDNWWKLCKMTYELYPQSFGVSVESKFNQVQTFLLFVNSIAFRVDISEAEAISSNSSSLVTGRWALSYLIESMESLSKHENKNWVMCNDGIEHLIRSPFLNDRGLQFLSSLIFNLQLSNLPSVFISNDSASVLLLASKYYEAIFNKILNNTYTTTIDRSFDVDNFEFYDLPEVPQDQVMSFLSSTIPSSEKFIKTVYKITGGNWYLINKIVEDFKEFEKKLNLGTVQQILSGSSNIVDDEYFPINKSKDDQIGYLKEEQFKMFIKNLYHETLNSDVLKFENSMNEFLSNPSIEKMRENSKNPVHFKVILFETIRHLLEKKWMRLKDEVEIDNKVILGLISANIMYYQIPSGMLEFKNSLVRYLLKSYIDFEYESLKPIEKVEYKANLLLNQKTLYQDLDSLFV